MNHDLRLQPRSAALPDIADAVMFNLLLALPGRVSSRHTQRAYYRWIDRYLVDVAGLAPTQGDARLTRMGALPLRALYGCLNPPQLRAWLGALVRSGQGRQGVNQARSAIVTLASLLAEAGWLDDTVSAAIRNVRTPAAADGQRPGRWLSARQINLLMGAATRAATSEHQEARNRVVMMMLCTMALRREELAAAKWGDLSIENERPVLHVFGKGRRTAVIDVPRPVLYALDVWRRAVVAGGEEALAHTALVRRLWKGGRIGRAGLTPDGIWLVVNIAARQADLGHVAPHDLRRSVAGALHDSGVPIDTISRLLRHSNVAVTERYLSRLPQRNEGALLMSDMLGLGVRSDTAAPHPFHGRS